MNWCPVCNHPVHDATWECQNVTYNFAQEYGCSTMRKCGCTFSAERVKRGEADALAGRVVSLKDAMRRLRERFGL